ncbi:MAG: hypothetical protein ACLFU3_07995 [Dichotomicrobium sp.]
MSGPIVYIDRSEVREGKLDALKAAIDELAAFIEANVPQAISYGIYLDATETRMTVIQIQPDSAALEYHMKVGAPAFAKFKDLIRLTGIEVYGVPSDHLLKQLEEKARMLGGGGVTVNKKQGGFARFG